MSYEDLVEQYKKMNTKELIRLAEVQRAKVSEAKRVLKAIEDAIVYRCENNLE